MLLTCAKKTCWNCPAFFFWNKLLLLGNESILLYPKDPDMSWERDFPYNPTLGMGMRPSILLQGGVWILRDKPFIVVFVFHVPFFCFFPSETEANEPRKTSKFTSWGSVWKKPSAPAGVIGGASTDGRIWDAGRANKKGGPCHQL